MNESGMTRKHERGARTRVASARLPQDSRSARLAVIVRDVPKRRRAFSQVANQPWARRVELSPGPGWWTTSA